MKAESIGLGERLIAQEAEFDARFARKTIDAAELDASTQAIGATQAALRATHLRYHLLTLKALTPAQTRRYIELRGYGADHSHEHGQSGHPQQH